MSNASGITLATTGMLPALILASVALAAPVSALLIWRYRRAVMRAMAGQGEAQAAPAASSETRTPTTAPPLDLRRIDAADAHAEESALYRQVRRSLVCVTGVYVAAGFAYALVLVGAWMYFTRSDGIVLTRLLWLLSCYAWPTVITVAMLAAVSRGQRILLGAGYFAIVVAIGLYALSRNPVLTSAELARFWLIENAPASMLLFALLRRRVRAVGPLVLAFMVAAVTGSQVLLSTVGASEFGMGVAADVAMAYGLSGTGMFFLLMVLGFALFGALGWRLLHLIGRRYQRRALSDQSLTLDAMWLVFGITQTSAFAFEGVVWAFTGLAAFLVYMAVTRLGFSLTGVARPAHREPTLLLLRVFSLGPRSERLFDGLAKRWLRAGSITMIAGPDLVASTVEPHEFIQYLGGQLSRQFVRDDADLEQRLLAMECGPDPDGKYRVNEFFCYADTWQAAMRRLAAGADVVLMDLRSFAPNNQGCIFEIEQLLAAVDLRRVVLLVDATSDARFLEQALQAAWQRVPVTSPNRRLSSPDVRLVHLSAQTAPALRGLLRLLCAQAGVGETTPVGTMASA